MRVPQSLAHAFGPEYEKILAQTAIDEGLLPDLESIHSDRFLSRSVLPHIEALSARFNRIPAVTPDGTPLTKKERLEAQSQGLDKYWKASSNPKNLRLAYFLSFLPANQARIASVWAELYRLGFRWSERKNKTLKGIELGAGPAAGATGIALAEDILKKTFKGEGVGLPQDGNWALLEQDRATLKLGERWCANTFQAHGFEDWGVRPFHRSVDLTGESFLPRTAPRFDFWISSFFLNESDSSPAVVAKTLLETWSQHLDDEGIVILVEPALKQQSRKLLEIRKEILNQHDRLRGSRAYPLQLLLPCLGHQTCGALANENDWCHEEANWWRPPYFKKLDQMAGLDRKTLPFSYLVFIRSDRKREEILPALQGLNSWGRLVSPAHYEGKDQEFFFCSPENGKKRLRSRLDSTHGELERGDILGDPVMRGDLAAGRLDSITRWVGDEKTREDSKVLPGLPSPELPPDSSE